MLRNFLTALRGLVLGRQRAGEAPKRPPAPAQGTVQVSLGGAQAAPAATVGRHEMNTAYERLIQHLDEREVRYTADSDTRSIYAEFRGEVGTYRIIAVVDADAELFQVFGCAPVRVPDGARPAIAETLTRANYGLKVGAFELDWNDGELRFHASQILSDGNLNDEVIGRLMGTTFAMLDMYLPAVMSVIYGNELPLDAIRCAEARRGRSQADE